MQRVCCSEKEFINSGKKRALLLQRWAVLTKSVCKQQTSEGVDLRISSTTVAYPLQKKHHPLLQGNLFSFKILYSITENFKL